MSFFNIESLVIASAVIAIYPAWKLIKDYLSLRGQRKTIGESFLLRSRVKTLYSVDLHNIEIRDGTTRRIVISPHDLDKIDNIQHAYELLIDKDLSRIRNEIEIELKNVSYDQAFKKYIEVISPGNKSLYSVVLNAGILRAAVSSKLSSIRPTDEASSSILGLMLGRRMQSYTKAYSYLLASLGIGTLLHLTSISDSSYLLGIAVPLVFIFATALNQKVLEYRVNRGYFGNNSSEAAEFIRFVKDHSDKSDFNDGDKMKKLLPEAKAAVYKEVVVYGGEAIA